MAVQPPGETRPTPPSPEDPKAREAANNLGITLKETTKNLDLLLASPSNIDNETFLQGLASSFTRLDELSQQAQEMGN